MASTKKPYKYEPTDVKAVLTGVGRPEIVRTPTVTVTSKKHPDKMYRATEWHGKKDIRVRNRAKPVITDPEDAIIKVTATAICGSDLHMYEGFVPGMLPGDVVGHEFMGIIEEVGSNVKDRKPGDRVVVCFDIACKECSACYRTEYSCCDTTNPSKEMQELYGDRTAGFFGYSHLTGGWEGGQAEYARVPRASINTLPVPDELSDDQVLFLSDILPTAWWANDAADVGKGDNVAIFGAGPVGILAAQCAYNRGAAQVVVIDEFEYRLNHVKTKVPGVQTINFSKQDVYQSLRAIFPHGPDCCLECAGLHYIHDPIHKTEVTAGLETDTSEIVNTMIYNVRKGGRMSLIGVYLGYSNHFNLGAMMEKEIRVWGGQTPVQRYWPLLLEKVKNKELDPTIVITHKLKLSDAPLGYDIFDNKKDGCIKVVLQPQKDPGEVTDKGITEKAKEVLEHISGKA